MNQNQQGNSVRLRCLFMQLKPVMSDFIFHVFRV
jgi:hypothetical protein